METRQWQDKPNQTFIRQGNRIRQTHGSGLRSL